MVKTRRMMEESMSSTEQVEDISNVDSERNAQDPIAELKPEDVLDESLNDVLSETLTTLQYSVMVLSKALGDLPDLISKVSQNGSIATKPSENKLKPQQDSYGSSQQEYEVFPAHLAFKIYVKGLDNFQCKKIGDGSFFTAKRARDRLSRDFPVTEETRSVISLAFDGDARAVFEGVI